MQSKNECVAGEIFKVFHLEFEWTANLATSP